MKIIEETYDWAYSLSARSVTTDLILHHAAISSASAQDIHRIHRYSNGWNGIGYHYYVRKDGNVYRGRPEYAMGSHAIGMNNCSIGICFEGNFESEYMQSAQLLAGWNLVQDIKSRYPGIRISGHRDHNATACPGKHFPVPQITSATAPVDAPNKEDVEMTKAEVEAMITKAIQATMQTQTETLYQSLDDVPAWGRDIVAKLVNKGYLRGDGEGLNLDATMLRILVVNDRAGLYD